VKIFDALKDAAQVAQDVAAVALKFQSLPTVLLSAGKDAVSAVVNWDATSAQRILDDVRRIRDEEKADAAGATAEFDALDADVQKLVTDLS
jgi:hypothetical protein